MGQFVPEHQRVGLKALKGSSRPHCGHLGSRYVLGLMIRSPTDFSLSLEELTGLLEGDPSEAPTPLMAEIQRSWRKPLAQLAAHEIGNLVVQLYGFPYLLDLVFPKLEADPLYDGGYYPGDVLSNLIRADREIWAERPEYRDRLGILYRRALDRALDENEAFRESLDLPDLGAAPN